MTSDAFLRQDWLFGPTSTDTPKTQSICADILSSFAPHTKASLNELSKIMGLPGKSGGSAGTDVERYFLEGKIKEIADYCETDVVNTYRVG
jgi:predicted PolB exonuclease-like 3'-5' exonuclease